MTLCADSQKWLSHESNYSASILFALRPEGLARGKRNKEVCEG